MARSGSAGARLVHAIAMLSLALGKIRPPLASAWRWASSAAAAAVSSSGAAFLSPGPARAAAAAAAAGPVHRVPGESAAMWMAHRRSALWAPTRVRPRSCGADPAGPVLMAADDDDGDGDDSSESADGRTLDSVWDIGGLKKEAARLVLRAHKKIGKASSRLDAARARAKELLSDPDATLEELEACPNVDALAAELEELRARLGKLNDLEGMLQGIKKREGVLPGEAVALALELGVNDAPPGRAPRGPKKKKGPKSVAARLPYRKFYAKDGTEIRVGKRADDNDELSLNPAHRDRDDWWMHASGCPGSHVVIRCRDQDVDEEVVKDAAALAARQSKCTGNVVKVSMVRCREVTKPRGAKAGLVQLSGQVRTVTVDMRGAEGRLRRLDETVVLN